jgi:hypothetical protein
MGFPFSLDLAGAKDKSLSKLLLASARQYLKEFGEVLDIALDTAARTIAVEVLPVGEREPIRVDLTGYGLSTDGEGGNWLTFEGLRASREWMTLAAARLLPQRRLRLPPGTPMGLLQTLL